MAEDALQRCAQCAERAWRLACALMRNAHDAEDVVQESFVVAARRRDRIPTDDPWPWFATVVTNVARNARRTRRKHMHDEPRDTPAPSTDTDLSVLVAEALAQLPEPERDALACTHLSGLTQAQAAEALDIPTGTVATRVRGGLARLRKKLGRDEKEVALAIGIMFIPAPASGIEVSTKRWVATAAARASQASFKKGEGMRTKLVLAVAGVLVVGLLTWLGVDYLVRSAFDDPGPVAVDPPFDFGSPDHGDGNADTRQSNRATGGGLPAAVDDKASLSPDEFPTDSASRDDVMRLPIGTVETLDPVVSATSGSDTCIELLYEPLYERDPFDVLRTRPLIAAGPVAFDSEYMSGVVTLRDDVRFCDDPCFPDGKGRPVTAEDVVYSLKRALLVSPRRISIWDALRGIDDFRKIDDELEGLQLRDPYTVAFLFKEPTPMFSRFLANPAFSIVAREAVEYYGDKLARHAVGTGPYVIESYEGEVISFVRNPGYRETYLADVPAGSPLKKFEGRRLPLVDRIVLAAADAGIDDLLVGRASIISVGIDDLAPLLEEGQLRLKERLRNAGMGLIVQPTDNVQLIEFDMRNKVIGTPGGEKARAMRRAIMVAFDRKGYVDHVFGHHGVPSDSMMTPGLLPDVPEGRVPEPDPELARRYLADAGFLLHMEGGNWVAIDPDTSEQPKLAFTLRDGDAFHIRKGEYMEELGRRIGLRIEAQQEEDWNAFVRLRMDKEGKGQIFDMGWSGGSSPAGRFQTYVTDGPFSSFSNEEYDRQVQKLEGLHQPGTHKYREALDALPKVVEILEREVPVFAIAYWRSIYVARSDLVRPSWPTGFSTNKKYWAYTGQE